MARTLLTWLQPLVLALPWLVLEQPAGMLTEARKREVSSLAAIHSPTTASFSAPSQPSGKEGPRDLQGPAPGGQNSREGWAWIWRGNFPP